MSHPQPRFLRATPVLRVADYPRARAFYVDKLGMRVVEEGGEPPRFGILSRGRSTIFLDAWKGGPHHPEGDHGWDAYLHVRGLRRMAPEFAASGCTRGELRETAYGMLELELVDPDGNTICLGEDHECPMEIARNSYVLAVHDLDRTRDWYERVIGCTTEEVDPGNWLFLHRDGVTFMVGRCPDSLPPVKLGDHSYFAYLAVDGVDEWAARAEREQAEFIKPLKDEPWGMREFGLRTVDGHRIMLGEQITL